MCGMVPGLVLVGVIEDHCLTLTPTVDVVFDANAELLARLGHDQSEMQP